jgi:uncharacterized protein (TIGR00369 family)
MNRYEGSIAFDIVARDAESATAVMPVTPGMLNPFGTVHAGAMLWFADVTATTLALEGRELTPGMSGFPLAVSLNAHLLGNQQDGTLEAVARYVRRGRTLAVVRTVVSGADGRLLADVTTSHVMSR